MPYQNYRPTYSWGQSIAPSQMDIRLDTTFNEGISGAVTTKVTRFYMNSAYQPQVGGTTAATPGYNTWSAIYRHYRVIKFRFHIEIVNKEAFPVYCYVGTSTVDPGTSVVSSSLPRSQSHLLPAKGGLDRCVFRGAQTQAQIVGSNECEFDDTHAAIVTANPTDLVYFWIGIQDASGTNLTNGVEYFLRFSQFVRFYGTQSSIS